MQGRVRSGLPACVWRLWTGRVIGPDTTVRTVKMPAQAQGLSKRKHGGWSPFLNSKTNEMKMSPKTP